jgi:hypothetical protein
VRARFLFNGTLSGTSPFQQLSDALGRGYEPFLYDPNPTFNAIRRTVELVGKGNPLERGLIEAVITGRSPSDAGARAPCPSR